MNQNDKEYKDKEYKQIDLLTEYGTATTAYLLMAMSIDSLEYKNRQLKTKNIKLQELIDDMWTYMTEPVGKRNNLKERLARLDDIGDRVSELRIEMDK